ncbi:transcriptional regulator [Planococcus faecalis]|nr:transcriptional regulator [Planococcus faecalis]
MTIRDVAKEAELSIATVSRYLNGKGYVSQKAEIKIRDVMNRLDFKPNEIARSLSNKKTNTIALIIPDILNPFFPELVVAIEGVAKERGYSLVLINTQEEFLHSSGFWRSLESRYIDGLILASFQFTEEVQKGMENIKLPFVTIDRAAGENNNNSIGIDNYKGAKMAVEHLIEVGCKNIVHISGPKTYPSSSDRLLGYIDAMKERFPDQKAFFYEGNFSLESGYDLTKQLIIENKGYDGIFLANDFMAIGAIKALKEMKVNVPEEMAIIGFDGIKLTEMVDPEISTIKQPIYALGAKATTRLINIIEKKENQNLYSKLEVRLMKKESTLGFKKNKGESTFD